MITLTATAVCQCGWTAGPGDWQHVDAAAERHTKTGPGHVTGTVARPAARMVDTDGDHERARQAGDR
jgi:hypothetical protein